MANELLIRNGMLIPSGSAGIGVSALESWQSAFTALQVGGNAAIMATTAEGSANSYRLLQNAYYDGAYKYISTDEASMYTQYAGIHQFQRAVSGTFDTEISWLETMYMDQNGLIGIGIATPSDYNSVANKVVIYNGSGDTGMTIATGTTNVGHIYFADGTSGTAEYMGFMQYSHSTNHMEFGTSGAVQFVIDDAGLVGIGQTSPDHYIHVKS